MKRVALVVALLLLVAGAGETRVLFMRRGTPTTGLTGQAPDVWSNNTNTKGVWYLEENGTTNRANAKSGGAELLESASISNTTDAKQGTYAQEMPGTEQLSCTNASCGTDLNYTTSFSAGCWAISDLNTNVRRLWARGTSSTTNNTTGYAGARTGSAEMGCYSQNNSAKGVTGSFPQSVWINGACTYNTTGTSMQAYVNGRANGSAVNTGAPVTNTNDFVLGSRADNTNAGQRWDGRLDECWIVTGTLAADKICRIARCGFDGEFCVCDATTPANYKSCASDYDCQEFSLVGTCDLTVGTCRGRMIGTCAGGANVDQPCTVDGDCTSSTCTYCAPVACDNAGP